MTDIDPERISPVDWEAFAVELCALLDAVEVSGDSRACAQRFDIAKKHGLTVEHGGPITAREQ